MDAAKLDTLTIGPNNYYGHGIWIHDEPGHDHQEYYSGSDQGVSTRSGMHRNMGLQVTVLSNTSDGAWPVLGTIDQIVWTER